MAKCIQLSYPGQAESNLYSAILANIAKGEETLAQEIYDQFFTPEFLEDFGDWMGDYQIRKANAEAGRDIPFSVGVNQSHIDTKGEPKIYEDASTGYWYYVNKAGKRRFFYTGRHLDEFYSYSEILNVSKILAFNYIKSSGAGFSDLDLTNMGETLQDSIKNKLNATIDKLRATGDPDKIDEADALQETTNSPFLEEWERHVRDYFRGLKLVYTEAQETQEIEEEEGSTRTEQFGTASFERSMKENISTNVKLRLSLLQNPDVKDPIFNEDIFVPFDDVYSLLLQKLTNRVALNSGGTFEDMFEIYLKEIGNMAERKPFLKSLHEELLKADENLKYEFVQAFNLDKYNFMTVEMEKNRRNAAIRTYKIMNVSGVGSKGKTIQSDWHNNFRSYYVNKHGKFLLDRREDPIIDRKAELVELDATVDRVIKAFSRKVAAKEYQTEADLEKIKNTVKHNLYILGVEVSPEAFDLYLDDLSMERKTLPERILALNKTLESTSFMLKDLIRGKIKPSANPFADQNIFNALAEAEAFFTNEGSDAVIFSAGKSKWVYSKPSYLSYKVKEWKKNPRLLEVKLNSAYGESSRFIKYLLAHDEAPNNRARVSQERLNNFEITTFNTFQERRKGKEGKDNKDIAINDFDSVTLNNLLQSGAIIYNSPTPADKGTHYQIQLGEKARVKANALRSRKTGKITLSGEVIETFYNYFKSEYKRMKVARDEVKFAEEMGDTSRLTVHYHLGNENAFKSQLFPSLSHGNFDGIAHGFELYNKDGSNALEDLDTVKDQLMDYIEERLVKGVEDTLGRFHEKGLINTTKDGGLEFPGVDKNVVDGYRQLSETDVDLRIAADAYVNGLIGEQEYAKLFSGDVAFYKNSVDYKKRIPATYTDGLQLRLRSFNEVKDKAEQERLRKGEYTFNTAVIESIYRGSPIYKELAKTLRPEVAKYYKDGINSADAQAWITPQRWKFLMERLGKWDSTYEALYNNIMSGKEIKLNEKDLKKVMQPLKGVYFDVNGGTPVYLKYSQAVLIPRLIKGSPLEKLYDKMTKDENGNELPFHKQVHETVTIDGVKVGAHNPVVTHDADGNMLDDFKLVSMPLSNSGWKLQQDLPTKTFKPTAVGSQIQKNIFGGLANNPTADFLVGDKEMKGSELIEHINSIVEALSEKGKGSLIADFDIRTGNKFGNTERVYQALIDELKTRGSNQNIIDALEAGISPYGIPQAQKTLMNVFSSLFLKKLVKIKTNGGAFIQLSNYGINKQDGDDQGVIWSPRVKAGHTPTEPHFLTNEKGEYILTKSGKKIVKPGEVLISGSFIAKYIPRYREYTPQQLFGDYNPETGKYEDYTDADGNKKKPLIDNNIIQGLVGYRIPNQGMASNDALEIVGIMPEEVGDTIVAYTGITTKTGSDFDIDKMYMMMPTFLPDRGIKSRLREYVQKEFTKNGHKETLANLSTFAKELHLDTDVRELSNMLMGTKDEKGLKRALNKFTLDILDNAEGSTNTVVKTIETLARTERVERLQYIEPDTDEEGNIKPAADQSKDALNNMLIQAYKAVLTNPATINEVMTPIDFDYIKNDINDLHRKEPPADLDDFDIFKDIDLKYEFLAGKAGVGQEANALVDHIRGQMADLYIKGVYLGRGNTHKDNGFTILDREMSEQLSEKELKAYMNDYNEGKKEKDQLSWEEVKSLGQIKIANSLSAVLNAFVDIAKDPYITRGNWTTQTTNTGNMLLRAGFHPFYVNAFMGQPVIKEYIDFLTNKESKLVDETGQMKEKFKVDLVKRKLLKDPQLIEEYNNLTTYINRDGERVFNLSSLQELLNVDRTKTRIPTEILDAHARVFDTNTFKNPVTDMNLSALRGQIKGQSSFQTQLSVIEQFFEWQDMTKALRQSVLASKIDVSGYGKSIGSLMNMDNTIAKLLADEVEIGGIVGFDEKLRKNGKNTLLGAYKKNIIDWTKDVMQANPLMFLTAQPYVMNTYNQVSLDVKDDILVDDALTDLLEENYYSYLMSGFRPLQTSQEERDYLINTFPKDLEKLMDHPDVKEALKEGKYSLLEELYFKPAEDGTTYISMSNRKKSPEQETEMTAAWRDILDGDFDEILPELGEKLIKYSYLTSGFKMNINQFFTYIPTSWFIENNIDTYISETARHMGSHKNVPNIYDDSFIDQFYRHNMDNNMLVPKIQKSMIENKIGAVGFLTKSKEKKARRFVKMDIKTGQDEMLNPIYTTYLYKLQGYNFEGSGIYTNVSPLGTSDKAGNKLYEYSYERDLNMSTIDSNLKITAADKQGVIPRFISSKKAPIHAHNPVVYTGTIDLNSKIDDKTEC